MKKLIIHAGNHKTGSSSIQRFLFKNKPNLAKIDIGVFNEKGHSNYWLRPSFDEKVKVKIVDGFEKSLGQMEESTVVVSSENFSWMNDEKQLWQFKKNLDPYFTEYQVVFYLRRQDKHMVSHYMQGSKDLTFIENKVFGSEAKALPIYKEHFDDYLDYMSRIDKWSRVFGKKSLSIRAFDPALLVSGDVLEDFLGVVNINIAPESIRENESNGRIMTLISHLMVKNKISKSIQDSIKTKLCNKGKLLPSEVEAKKLLNRYRESNIKLNKEFNISHNLAIFDEDFSSYPEISNEEIGSEEVIGILNSIFEGLSSLPFKIEDSPSSVVNILRDSAIALEKQDLNKSRELMLLAHKLRPEGPLINKKLKEYNEKIAL